MINFSLNFMEIEIESRLHQLKEIMTFENIYSAEK